MPATKIAASGLTDVGLVREENQDAIYVDQDLGLYLVLDGMGGHAGGATASRTGREVIVDMMRHGLVQGREPAALLGEAIRAAGARIHLDANRNRELHGMGTTFVGIIVPHPNLAVIAHVGDSRAYVMRDQRLTRLTADHTVVAELVALGKLTPQEAHNHPHSSVLSRNLGGLPTTEVEFSQFEVLRGDRLLLCSDGLNGYATHGAIEKTLGGAQDPESAARDLVELAKRGGGGDNVSAVVIDIGPRPGDTIATSTLPQENGAQAWWRRRPLFMDVCQRMGLAQSSVAAGLEEAEAMEILAGSFCEAVYHDLENTTGVHVWTFADSLVSAWFAQDGAYLPIQELFDILRAGSLAVVKDVSQGDQNFGVCLEIALLRSLIVGEMVVGGQIGGQIQTINEELTSMEQASELPETTFSGNATIPFEDMQVSGASDPEVTLSLKLAFDATRKQLESDGHPTLRNILAATHASAEVFAGTEDLSNTARELYGTHLLTEQDLGPIINALDRCRDAHLHELLEQQEVSGEALSTAFARLSLAHQALFHAFSIVVVEAGRPTTDRLQELTEQTKNLRTKMANNEEQLSQPTVADMQPEDSES